MSYCIGLKTWKHLWFNSNVICLDLSKHCLHICCFLLVRHNIRVRFWWFDTDYRNAYRYLSWAKFDVINLTAVKKKWFVVGPFLKSHLLSERYYSICVIMHLCRPSNGSRIWVKSRWISRRTLNLKAGPLGLPYKFYQISGVPLLQMSLLLKRLFFANSID